jgi:hypothetical protein
MSSLGRWLLRLLGRLMVLMLRLLRSRVRLRLRRSLMLLGLSLRRALLWGSLVRLMSSLRWMLLMLLLRSRMWLFLLFFLPRKRRNGDSEKQEHRDQNGKPVHRFVLL